MSVVQHLSFLKYFLVTIYLLYYGTPKSAPGYFGSDSSIIEAPCGKIRGSDYMKTTVKQRTIHSYTGFFF